MGANFSELQYEDPGPAITNDRVVRIVKKVEGTDDVVIESIQEETGREAGGEGLGSDMGVVDVQAVVKPVGQWSEPEQRSYNWVMKSQPREYNRFIRSHYVFGYNEREIKFFRDLLPRLRKFAESKENGYLFPSFVDVPFASWSEEDKVLVMQDLIKAGYKDGMYMLSDGLDLEHTKIAIRWLAKFHALGYAFFQQTFDNCRNWRCQGRGTCDCGIKNLKQSDLNIFLLKFCDIPNFEGIMNGYSTISEKNVSTTLDEIEKTGEKKYVEKFNSFIDEYGHFFGQCEQFKDNHSAFTVNTFVHGDNHAGNMMFKYGEENGGTCVRDVVFLDFQFVLYKPAVLDLHKFIWTSTTSDVRKNLTKVLKIYHDTFMESVHQLGSPLKYTFDELVKDFRRTFADGLYWATHIFVSMVCTPKEERIGMEELGSLCKEMLVNYNNPELKAEYDKLVGRLEESSRKNTKYQTKMKEFMDDVIDLDLIYSGSLWM